MYYFFIFHGSMTGQNEYLFVSIAHKRTNYISIYYKYIMNLYVLVGSAYDARIQSIIIF
jgi:hypothetical protein